MSTISAYNTNDMMLPAYNYIHHNGYIEQSRNGAVLTVPYPVTLTYYKPYQQVNFCPVRDANPFFHFMERLWFLEGYGDVELICRYLPRMADFSDNGMFFNAHYGHRLRNKFQVDQLNKVVELIKLDPLSRQLVCQIWHPGDLGKNTLDKACNMQLVFKVINHVLHMTVFNRSNDAVYGGVSGANITNLFVFQEYVAGMTGLQIGPLHVVSNNLHIYLEDKKSNRVLNHYLALHEAPRTPSQYDLNDIKYDPMITEPDKFDDDLSKFMDWVRNGDVLKPSTRQYSNYNYYFYNVATPIVRAHAHYKNGNMANAMDIANTIFAKDWWIGCVNWLNRRKK